MLRGRACERKVLSLPIDIKPLHLQNWACEPAQTTSKGYLPVLLLRLLQLDSEMITVEYMFTYRVVLQIILITPKY